MPYVSLIITAYNEETNIKDKIDNTFKIEYPQNKLDIIVASDASDDSTDMIVESFKHSNLRLIRSDERKGKEHAQLIAINEAQGEIIIFSDVSTRIHPDAIKKLTAYFSDKKIGAVSSEDKFITEYGHIVGEGVYVKYEMWLRNIESCVAGLVGLSGSFFAARREVCMDWDARVPSDFNTALNCARMNYIAVNAPDVYGLYADITDESKEYQRKLRTVIRGITALFYHPDVLNPFRYGLFAFQVWSHKICRWLVPWFMIGLFPLSIILINEGWIYILMALMQFVFYIAVFAATLSQHLRKIMMLRIPYYFVQANLAIVHATILFLSGKRITTWTPSKR